MKVLITGGAGFIGVNTAYYYAQKKHDVIILDNFSRLGNRDNISWLKKNARKKPSVVEADLRDPRGLKKIVNSADIIFHFAGQVTVTKSVQNPMDDFENNLLGTLNLLEAIRISKSKAVLLYSSTNKVYGALDHLQIAEKKTRYEFTNLPKGVPETTPLDFYSPYGCSKGASDQYIRDYHRIYGLRTIVFRQSCIYGPHQFGIEDQGWVAWFIIAVLTGKPITIYGNGKQVRDLLYIDDLLNAFDLATTHIEKTQGSIYNIGGGAKNTLSVWYEFLPILTRLLKKKIPVIFADIRPGDQPIYISDISKAKRDFDWQPKISVENGIELLYAWILQHKKLFLS